MTYKNIIGIDAFARVLRDDLAHERTRYAFFLGAGCSVSSGIDATTGLVRRWLQELKELHTGKTDGVDAWAKDNFPDYDPKNPGASYSDVMLRRFNTAQKRQVEIERITRKGKPGYGYSVLAKLLSHEQHGQRVNVVLTTNFDDLVADALYMFGRESARPLVIGHEALISFVRVTRTAPMVVKLHHDRHLEPKNTVEEIATLSEQVKDAFHRVLQERGLIVLGYGGNDPSVAKALVEMPAESLPGGVYWINDAWPNGDLGAWLEKRDAVWVKHRDFDQAMFMIAKEFGVEAPPEPGAFLKLFDEIKGTYKGLLQDTAQSTDPDQASLRQAAQEAGKKISDAFGMLLMASILEDTDPDAADATYRRGIDAYPDHADLLGQYGRFLYFVRKDMDGAEEHYKRAIDADPNNANNLGNYANFLKNVRKDMEGAEAHYKRALKAEPNHANNLGNYANFLKNVRKDMDGAEEHYKRAIDADPNNANNLGNYARFLHSVRKDMGRAEEHYKRAIDADPNHANNLGNYASFLHVVRKDMDGAEEHYKRALDADPNHANNLGNYASFLHVVRKDMDRAEKHYNRALDADPNNADILGNYAGFLLAQGRRDEGEALLSRCEAANPPPPLLLECRFYRLCHLADADERSALLTDIKRMIIGQGETSPGFDLSANAARARSNGHPWADLLDTLAKVIAEDQPAAALDAFDLWKNA